MSDKLLKKVDEYYTEKVILHGNTSKGVDWNTKETQYLRFIQLAKAFEIDDNFSILDYGCGTGAFVDFLQENSKKFSYHGFDVSDEMIKVASQSHNNADVSFSTAKPVQKYDYVVASGVFNVRFNFSESEWMKYIYETIETMNQISTKGFSFNLLSIYSDVEKRRSDLFYGDGLKLFDHCKKEYSKFVSLIHDYPLYEFTIVVRKKV